MTKRRHDRVSLKLTVEYSITVKKQSAVKNIQLTGIVRDVSAGGVGLITDYPLMQGNMIRIKSSAPEVPKYGVVRWVNREGESYRVGLRSCSHCGEY
ncbi:MAG: PilZ domain-containing protein [Nitrospirota bacterium]|nr:PilZ domain-containing protein [Nitrospirota bacterium]